MGFFFFPQPFLAGFLLGVLGSGAIGDTFGAVGAKNPGAFHSMVGLGDAGFGVSGVAALLEGITSPALGALVSM